MKQRGRQGFTFVEILVVITIIGVITAIGTVTYSGFLRQSRDTKRKGDLEQIRGALEMYRSKNDQYPLTAEIDFASGNGKICDPPAPGDCASGTYLSKLPNDPITTNTYWYQSTDGSTYTIGALLENAPASGSTCGTCGTVVCNYCMGPFGQL